MSPPTAFFNTSVSAATRWLLLEKNMPGVSDGFLQSYMEKRQTAWRLKMRSARGKHASHFHACLLLLGRGMGRGGKEEGQGNELCCIDRQCTNSSNSIRKPSCQRARMWPLATCKASRKFGDGIIISVSMYNYPSTVMAEFKFSESDPWLPLQDANSGANRGNYATGRNRYAAKDRRMRLGLLLMTKSLTVLQKMAMCSA